MKLTEEQTKALVEKIEKLKAYNLRWSEDPIEKAIYTKIVEYIEHNGYTSKMSVLDY